jgi:hypothetical protein
MRNGFGLSTLRYGGGFEQLCSVSPPPFSSVVRPRPAAGWTVHESLSAGCFQH